MADPVALYIYIAKLDCISTLHFESNLLARGLNLNITSITTNLGSKFKTEKKSDSESGLL